MADPWKRREVIGDATLYLGDCLDILPTLPKVDAVITDPPYVLSDSSPGTSHQFGNSLNKFDSDGYKAIVCGFDVPAVFGRLEAICKPFNLFCFCSNRQVSQVMAYHEGRGRSTTLCVWHKTNAAPFANGVWRGDIEYCVHAKDSGAVFRGGAVDKKKVTEHPIVQDDAHPTVKPLPVVSKYVGICSTRGQAILDPFMGSGTTGVACMNLGRKFIGIEIEERYFDIAVERITNAQRQSKMFSDENLQTLPAKQASIGI